MYRVTTTNGCCLNLLFIFMIAVKEPVRINGTNIIIIIIIILMQKKQIIVTTITTTKKQKLKMFLMSFDHLFILRNQKLIK